MARLTWEQQKVLREKEGCDRIWSWSRINCFRTSPYEYFLKYILRVKEDVANSIYLTMGGVSHDTLEKYYTNKIEYDDMINQFEDGWTTAFDIADLKFDRNDEEHNKKIADSYYKNLQYFFKQHISLKDKTSGSIGIEKPVTIKIGNELFVGYVDCCYKDEDGLLNIIDFKTSTAYKGKKAVKESGQLMLYALGFIQHGVPIEKIRVGWNFLKYTTVIYTQGNATTKERDVERSKLAESLLANAKMWLKKFGYNEVDSKKYLDKFLQTNDITVLPQEVQDRYDFRDCYVYVPLTKESLEKFKEDIALTIQDIRNRESDYISCNSDKAFWDSAESVKKNSYYFSTLCGYSANLHKPYKQYLEQLEKQKQGIDLLGRNSKNNENENEDEESIQTKKIVDDDLAWLNDI